MTSSITKNRALPLALVLALSLPLPGQVYSPRVLKEGQPDASDMQSFTRAICAGARTPREKAEAIWRFFLTDGRFVRPGFWYHIAGWAYEEPKGEVLDALKLLNSYGFGLCYHIAPLLEAMFDAAGFADSRVWFLTGHTVAEVFYDGAYHYYDSDMMGYTTLGNGPPRESAVASVRDIERNGTILTSRLKSAREVNAALVDPPWYPADVREAAIDGLTELFTTISDNRLYAFGRYSQGHAMEYVLRPGERIIRYYRPEEAGLYYLPYKFDGKTWSEFPQEVAQYNIRTEQGPRSQKDARLWATGRIEYQPDLAGEPAEIVIDMPSPYVIIDAAAEMHLKLGGGESVIAATSVDGGRAWTDAGRIIGPYSGAWKAEAATLTRSAHGRRTALSGTYRYLLRLTRNGGGIVTHLRVTTRFQFNPRTLPELRTGDNDLVYSAGPQEEWHPLPVRLASLSSFAAQVSTAEYIEESGQGFVRPKTSGEAVLLFEIPAHNGFSAGGRFLDVRDGVMPDKLTAEVRQTSHAVAPSPDPSASIEWSSSHDGPFTPLWTYKTDVQWRDGERIDRLLRWPEVDRTVRSLPPGTKSVWVRYRLHGVAVDDIRLSAIDAARGSSPLEITHVWTQSGKWHEHTHRVEAGAETARYAVSISGSGPVGNEALILSCPR